MSGGFLDLFECGREVEKSSAASRAGDDFGAEALQASALHDCLAEADCLVVRQCGGVHPYRRRRSRQQNVAEVDGGCHGDLSGVHAGGICHDYGGFRVGGHGLDAACYTVAFVGDNPSAVVRRLLYGRRRGGSAMRNTRYCRSVGGVAGNVSQECACHGDFLHGVFAEGYAYCVADSVGQQ